MRLTQQRPRNHETANPSYFQDTVSAHASIYPYLLIQRSPMDLAPRLCPLRVFQRRYLKTKPNSDTTGLVRPKKRNTSLRTPLKACLLSHATLARKLNCKGFFFQDLLRSFLLAVKVSLSICALLQLIRSFYESTIHTSSKGRDLSKELRGFTSFQEFLGILSDSCRAVYGP